MATKTKQQKQNKNLRLLIEKARCEGSVEGIQFIIDAIKEVTDDYNSRLSVSSLLLVLETAKSTKQLALLSAVEKIQSNES